MANEMAQAWRKLAKAASIAAWRGKRRKPMASCAARRYGGGSGWPSASASSESLAKAICRKRLASYGVCSWRGVTNQRMSPWQQAGYIISEISQRIMANQRPGWRKALASAKAASASAAAGVCWRRINWQHRRISAAIGGS